MWPLRVWFVFALLEASPAYAAGISGTYVGQGVNSAFLVQIVESSGGQLTGRYEQTLLEPGGKVDQMIATMTGASDGQTVVVTIKPTGLLSGSITASGTMQGEALHLSGGGSGTRINLNLSRSDEVTYRTEVAALADQARRLNEARAQADELVRLNELTNNMLTYSAAADAQLVKFPPIEKSYRTITKLMNADLDRQRAIYGGGQASVARGQIGVAINQTEVEAEQVHIRVQSANRDIGAKIQPLIKRAVDFNRRCQSDGGQQNGDLHGACLRFFDAAKKFKQSMENLGRAFDQTEKVWLEEHTKQDSIVQASNVASK